MQIYVDLCALRASPVSVDHNFGAAPTPEPVRAVLPIAAFSLNFMYQQLISHRLWSARFDRGGENGAHGPAVRTLVTRHLGSPAADGWNVVAGAVELARVWGLRDADLPNVVYTAYDLSYDTRMRLAVCLSVAWKFERQLCSHFPRRFYDEEPNLLSPHTYELAYLGLSFMTDSEREAFGTWGNANARCVRTLYDQLVRLEMALLAEVRVFSTLTSNPQVQAEARIQEFFERDLVNDEGAMATRSIVPFFNATWQNGYSTQPSPGALVCAALQCVRVVDAERYGRSDACALAALDALFSVSERARARELVRGGLHLKEVPAKIVALGCYADPGWINYEYVAPRTLTRVLGLAAKA
mgnify:FL=1|tara:strand:+ start:1820 stop:2884 length:1065 start_codon:yes stop_codon:yes gene_type:complete